jgi:3-deoxy-7-phosphoheptulonate synthase
LLLLLKPQLPVAARDALLLRIRGLGYEPRLHENLLGAGQHGVVIQQTVASDHVAMLGLLRGVERVVERGEPHPLVDRAARAGPHTVEIPGLQGAAGARFGPGLLTLIAGPCAVESLDTLLLVARRVQAAGADLMRGGAFKPRTSPYSFQGLGRDGIGILTEVRRQTGLPFVTEVLDPRDVAYVAEHADMLQVGSRNQQNFALLKEVGRARRPVLLKRGMACTLKEFLLAAEYVLEQGNERVVLCERGVRGFDPAARNLLDLAAVPALRERTWLPIVVDPSHGTGRRELVPAMAKAAVAAGADGLMIEVHHSPETALSDGRQALTPSELEALAPALWAHARIEGRRHSRGAADREGRREQVGSAGSVAEP